METETQKSSLEITRVRLLSRILIGAAKKSDAAENEKKKEKN
jgi:hypothetical protein